MRGGNRAVVGRAGHGDLELARQELEFRVVGGPLPDQLGHGAGILDLVGRSPREMVGGHVADRVAAGLDGVHLHRAEGVQHVGNVAQLRPVVLDVLAGGEMAVALVPTLGQVGELPHLGAVQRAVGNGHAQHVGVQLQVDAVHQAQGLEFVLGQAAVDAAFHLRAELKGAFCHEGGVEIGVVVHLGAPGGRRSGASPGWVLVRRARPACHGDNLRGRCGGNPRGNARAQARPARRCTSAR